GLRGGLAGSAVCLLPARPNCRKQVKEGGSAMFGFLVIVLLAAIVWLLWSISRNSADALDKQTALQYEVVALEKRLDEVVDLIRESAALPGSQSIGADQVDINRADLRALMGVPRIGKAMAQRIIE